jgi:hypothetical protein
LVVFRIHYFRSLDQIQDSADVYPESAGVSKLTPASLWIAGISVGLETISISSPVHRSSMSGGLKIANQRD